MDVLDQVISLLYRARSSSTSLIATLDKTIDTALEATVNQEWMKRLPGKPLVRIKADFEAFPTLPPYIKNEINIWWQRSTFWRKDEVDLANNTVLRHIVRCGSSSIFSSTYNTLSLNKTEASSGSNEVDEMAFTEPLLDPSFLLSHHEIRDVEKTHHANRRGFGVLATPRLEPYRYTDDFWASADSYRLIVDADSGLLLYYAALVNDQVFASFSVKELSLNSPIPKSVKEPTIPEDVKLI